MKKIITVLSACAIMLSETCAFPAAAASKPATPVVAKAYSASANAVRINWAKIKGVSGYRVYRYDSSAKKWRSVKTISGSSSAEYRESGLSPATKYKYKVKAYKRVNGKAVWGSASMTKNVTTKPDAVRFTEASSTDTAVTLNWTPVKCSGYRIYQQINGKYTRISEITDKTAGSLTVNNLDPNTSYSFKVKAYARDIDLNRQYTVSDTITKKTTTPAPEPERPSTNWVDELSDVDRAYYNFMTDNFDDYDWNLIYNDVKDYAFNTFDGRQGNIDCYADVFEYGPYRIYAELPIKMYIEDYYGIERNADGSIYNHHGSFQMGSYNSSLTADDIDKVHWFRDECLAQVDDAIRRLYEDGWFKRYGYPGEEDDDNCPLNFDWYRGSRDLPVFIVLY